MSIIVMMPKRALEDTRSDLEKLEDVDTWISWPVYPVIMKDFSKAGVLVWDDTNLEYRLFEDIKEAPSINQIPMPINLDVNSVGVKVTIQQIMEIGWRPWDSQEVKKEFMKLYTKMVTNTHPPGHA